MEDLIFFVGAAVLVIVLIIIISVLISSGKRKRRRKQVEQYLMQGWGAIGKNDSAKARESYDKIRELYKAKYDKKGHLRKRIKLFYGKISGPEPQKK